MLSISLYCMMGFNSKWKYSIVVPCVTAPVKPSMNYVCPTIVGVTGENGGSFIISGGGGISAAIRIGTYKACQ